MLRIDTNNNAEIKIFFDQKQLDIVDIQNRIYKVVTDSIWTCKDNDPAWLEYSYLIYKIGKFLHLSDHIHIKHSLWGIWNAKGIVSEDLLKRVDSIKTKHILKNQG